MRGRLRRTGEHGRHKRDRTKPDEKAFEEHIVGSLVEDGGYRTVKVGNPSEDFDAECGQFSRSARYLLRQLVSWSAKVWVGESAVRGSRCAKRDRARVERLRKLKC
jgi:hypothetical protein